MSDITKEELMMLLTVQDKAATQMTVVAERLTTIAEQNKIIVDKMNNGMVSDLRDIKESVCGSDVIPPIITLHSDMKDLKGAICGTENNSGIVAKIRIMEQNSTITVKLAGIITIVVAISLGIMQFIHWLGHKNV